MMIFVQGVIECFCKAMRSKADGNSQFRTDRGLQWHFDGVWPEVVEGIDLPHELFSWKLRHSNRPLCQ